MSLTSIHAAIPIVWYIIEKDIKDETEDAPDFFIYVFIFMLLTQIAGYNVYAFSPIKLAATALFFFFFQYMKTIWIFNFRV